MNRGHAGHAAGQPCSCSPIAPPCPSVWRPPAALKPVAHPRAGSLLLQRMMSPQVVSKTAESRTIRVVRRTSVIWNDLLCASSFRIIAAHERSPRQSSEPAHVVLPSVGSVDTVAAAPCPQSRSHKAAALLSSRQRGADAGPMLIMPRGFDQQTPDQGIARSGDSATPVMLAGRILSGQGRQSPRRSLQR